MMNIWKLLANVGMALAIMVATVTLYVYNIPTGVHNDMRHWYGRE